jgi:hypothetical protein
VTPSRSAACEKLRRSTTAQKLRSGGYLPGRSSCENPMTFRSRNIGVFGGNDVVTRLQKGMPEKFNNFV